MTPRELTQLVEETRTARQRLFDYLAGQPVYDQSGGVIYLPSDTLGARTGPFSLFDVGLFAHDVHVTAYVCNEALGLHKQNAARRTPSGEPGAQP